MTDRERGALAALDIGTNSIHLVVARPDGNGRFETITREKEVVRLGSGGGDMKQLSADAIERGVDCLVRLKAIADGHGATVRAVATSATREAVNSQQFLEAAADRAGVTIEVISGLEEARLIHLGVLQAVPVFDHRVLVIDIGGGSTELLLGECGETLDARSFKLGAVRLTDRFFPAGDVTAKAIKSCRSYVRSVIEHFHRAVREHGFDTAIVASGTAEALATMIHVRRSSPAAPLRTLNCFGFTADELAAVVDELCAARSTAARTKLDGLESGRADIIVAGALILDTIARTFSIERFTFSEAALREGVLLDTMSGPSLVHHLRDVTRHSIDRLVDRCDDDPEHSRHVAALAVELYDRLGDVGVLDAIADDAADPESAHDVARGYLEAGATLANVGLLVAHSKHHLHSHYLIRNSELAGLTDGEIDVIAQIARYHRKSAPKPSHPAFAALEPATQRLVRTLAAVLRVAIGLDRRHEQRVTGVAAAIGDDDTLTITVSGDGERGVTLEVYAANERAALLADVLARPVTVVAKGV